MRLFRVILLLGCLIVPSLYGDAWVESDDLHTIRVDCSSNTYKQRLQNFLPQEFYLEEVSYELDFLYDLKELEYLTGLKSNSEITLQQLFSACFYLKQNNRFKNISLEIEQLADEYSYSCKFILTGHMIFSHLSISGYMRGKDRYKGSYLLDIGEVFDEQKHQHSLDDIKKSFYDRGYCGVEVIDQVHKNVKQKTVSVMLAILKGHKFFIKGVHFEVEALGAISTVDVEKMKRKVREICSEKLKHKVYSADLVKKMELKIRDILERYGFMNFDITIKKKIDAKKHTVDVAYQIVLEQKKEFFVSGNHFFKRRDLLNHLLMYGKSSWHFPSSIIIDELVQLYKSKGFWDVQISVQEEKHKIICDIDENERASVVALRIKDNDHFSARCLSRCAFKQFFKLKYFDKAFLQKAFDSLIRFYKQQGFWDAKVVKEEYVPLQKKNTYLLELTLDEGKQRKVGSYKIQDYQELEKQGPFARIKKEFKAGFDPMIIAEQKQWLMRYFRNLGYHKVSVEYSLEELHDDTLRVVWKVFLKEEAVKFGKTLITGSSVVPPSYLMREVAFKESDSWDKSRLEETLKRLRELEVFDSVQMYPSRDVDDDLQKPVFMKVVDADKYELRTRMGLQQVGKNFRLRKGFTYKAGGSFFVRNPFQFGDRFAIEGDFTRFYRDFSASYFFPWLFRRAIRCQYKAYDKLYYQPVYIGSQCSLYQAGQRGFLFNMTKRFSKMTLSGTGGIEFMGIKEADQPDLHKIIDYREELLGKKTGYLFLEPTLMWQRVDNLINPKQGHLSFVSCKAMVDLDTNTSFFRLLIEHSFYMPLLDPLILAVRMRGGHVFNRCFNELIPIERFYLGGPGSLRGYDRDYCPPLGMLTEPIHDERAGLPPEACDLWRYAPQGARTMMNLNVELRFPLYKNLGGVVFNDLGFLFKDSVSDVLHDGSDNILGGTGFGFRYDTPIGPLRFDIGFKWNRLFRDFEARWVYYITLGHAF